MRTLCSAALCLVAASVAGRAQVVRGTVTDSVLKQPIPGVVVAVQNAGGTSLARGITNERGEFRLARSSEAKDLWLVRIGYRPRRLALPDGDAPMNVSMTAIPALLEQVEVRAASNCPRRNDRLAALSLLQQARAGLLATIVAREAKPASMVRLSYVREMDGNSDRILKQEVRVDSAGELRKSFNAVRSAQDFVRLGFVIGGGSEATFLGPDAEVLLADEFSAGYCFHIADHEKDRPTEVGLAFVSASRQNGRVDIDGVLWVDTIARSLRDIAFKYSGVPRRFGAIEPRGNVHFREMPNGVVFIDRWSLTLPVATADTIYGNDNRESVRVRYHARQSGGEVANGSWPDGLVWGASLGTLRALVLDYKNNPARGVTVRLADTDYLASPNASGIIEIPQLLPGPYSVLVIDSTLSRLGISIPTSLRFEAARDSLVERSFTMPRDEEFVRDGCLSHATDATAIVRIHAVTATGDDAPDVNVRITRDHGITWQVVTENGRTNEQGLFVSCLRFSQDDPFEVHIWRDGEKPVLAMPRVAGKLTEIKLPLPPARRR
jgi:hypothetical protein